MIRKIKILLLLILVTSNIYSQKSLVSFPTPEAAELGKYGQVPVSFFNGLPEISVPLYTIQCKDIELPISLSYHAAGNKPDEHPTWVGLGWNLNCGGMITRIVNGLRDEIDKDGFNGEYTTGITFNPGYYYRAYEFDNQNWASTLLTKITGNDLSYGYLDTQPDEFIFNFSGHSGSFWFVYENGQMSVKAKSKDGDVLKVEPILFPGTIEYPVFEKSPLYNSNDYKFKIYKTFQKFKVTTRDGFIYEFGGDIGNIDFTTTDGITSATSWHLTKITSPNGNSINLEYIKGGNVFIQRKSNYFYTSYSPQDPGHYCTLSDNRYYDGLSLAITHPKYLSKINTSSGQVISFITSNTTELDYNWTNMISDSRYYEIRKNLFIKSNLVNKFNWSTELPVVNYYLKLDHVKIEGLKNINFFYSNNNTVRLKLLGISTSIINGDVFPASLSAPENQNKYIFSYNQTPLPAYNSRKSDNWGFYNNKDYSAINESTLYEYRVPDLTYCKAEILENITYPTGGKTTFEYELNQYSKVISGLEFNNQPFTLSNVSDSAGGLRIRTITNYYDVSDNTKKTIKNYFYTNADGTSSGILSGKPIYSLSGKKHMEQHQSDWYGLLHWSENASFDVYYNIFSQNPLLPLSTTNGNHVTYSRIIEQESDGSKTIYNYTNHDQFPDEVPLMVSSNMNEVLYNHFTSKELERGLLTKVQIYNSNNLPVKETNFFYNNDPNRYNNYVKTINIYKQPGGTCNGISIGYFGRYSANKIYTFYPYLKSKTDTIYGVNGQNPIATTDNYIYNSYNLLESKSQAQSDGSTFVSKFKYPADYPNLSNCEMEKEACLLDLKTKRDQKFAYCKTITDPRDTAMCFSAERIQYNSDVAYCQNIYNNCINFPSDQKIILEMQNKNMISYVIEEQNLLLKVNETKLIGGKIHKYKMQNDMIVPDKEYELELSAPSSDLTSSSFNTSQVMTFHPSYKEKLTYDNYDTKGNIIQYHLTNNNNVSLLWAYNATKPVILVENVSYDVLKAAVESAAGTTNLETYWNGFGNIATNSTQQDTWKAFNTNLRNNASLANAQITTYTYSPLIGMTSKTSPAGVTTYYEYDALGRLSNVKNDDQKLINNYIYHYGTN